MMSSQVERFDVWRQRMALLALADSSDFLATAEGAAFLEQLRTFHAPGILGHARSSMNTGHGWLEADDIVNTAVVRLRADDGKIANYIAAGAHEPWAYLGRCLIGWVRKDRGTSGTDFESFEEVLTFEDLPPTDLTPLHEVVATTFEILAPVTSTNLHGPLLELLGWLAANPLQRLSYEVDEKIAAHRHCPELTIEQVTAVMNIAWGGRPRQAETSIMGQLLLNADFRVSDSPTHARALAYYKREMRAGARGSKLLTDWR